MELKTNYQYTYFIHPFYVQPEKYDKYMLKLLKNKKVKLKMFEKEKDFELYTYFLQNTRDFLFPSFEFTKEKIQKLNDIDVKMKAMLISKHSCSIFEYELPDKIQGKMGEKSGIFFKIEKIEIICFNTGVCFVSLKTNIEENKNFSDLLNFNYMFRETNSEFSNLREYENIKIQADIFKNMKELPEFIYELTGTNRKEDLYNQKFFTYTYVCVDSKDWNTTNEFSNIENDFLKLVNVLPSKYNSDFSQEERKNKAKVIEKWQYSRYGFTKLGGAIISSDIDMFNYTKLPYMYETQYFYTLILSLYQKVYLKQLSKELASTKNIEKVQKKFADFTKNVWAKEITNDETCTTIHKKWKETFELDELYKEVKNKYDILYKESNIEKGKNVNKIIVLILVASLILNIVNLTMMFIIK